MNLNAYFNRIGYEGSARADLATLIGVHRAHAMTIPYENLDVQLGRPLTRAPGDAFDKIVGRGRGGWCYEMNGLFGWALETMGFAVTRLAGTVMRETAGDSVIGNHLVLLVDLPEGRYVADVGFGDGLIEPAPLREGPIAVGPLASHLRTVDGGWWRYVDDPRSGGPGFDFNPAVRDDALMERCNAFLQTDPASPFVQNAVVQRWGAARHFSLRGRVLRVLSAEGDDRTVIGTAGAYVRTLKETFGLDLPAAASLWPAICQRHEAVFEGRTSR
ncbi:MAG: arylamine N-acetyltransferase family protein [Parvularculaceae bacterium]